MKSLMQILLHGNHIVIKQNKNFQHIKIKSINIVPESKDLFKIIGSDVDSGNMISLTFNRKTDMIFLSRKFDW